MGSKARPIEEDRAWVGTASFRVSGRRNLAGCLSRNEITGTAISGFRATEGRTFSIECQNGTGEYPFWNQSVSQKFSARVCGKESKKWLRRPALRDGVKALFFEGVLGSTSGRAVRIRSDQDSVQMFAGPSGNKGRKIFRAQRLRELRGVFLFLHCCDLQREIRARFGLPGSAWHRGHARSAGLCPQRRWCWLWQRRRFGNFRKLGRRPRCKRRRIRNRD